MGVGIIWFMPIHPIGEKNRKGALGSYYSVRDYKAVNPEFGTMADFKGLVEKIHGMGMYVIISTGLRITVRGTIRSRSSIQTGSSRMSMVTSSRRTMIGPT
jgi:hypothetical protein